MDTKGFYHFNPKKNFFGVLLNHFSPI
jgi:hypothetical protein